MRHSPSERRPSLWRTQGAFLQDLLELSPRTPEARRRAFQTPPNGTVEDRWHVYAHGFVSRIADALADEYAAIRRLLGAQTFELLVSRYLVACPPRSYDLAHAGDRFPAFLEADGLTARLPFLPDLATLERRIAEAFVAADGRPLPWSSLQAMPPEDAAEQTLALAAATALVESPWPLHDLWRTRHLSDDDPVDLPLEPGSYRTLVYRDDRLRVRCESVGEDEARLLRIARRAPQTLSNLVTRFAPGGGAPEIERAVLALRALFDRHVFTKPAETESLGPAI